MAGAVGDPRGDRGARGPHGGARRGEGAHFSAGADIAELGDVYRDAHATRDYGDAVQDGLKARMGLDRPTIAVIRGFAIGAGLGLALACDPRFCAADAHLAVTPAKLGLVYGHAETRRLTKLVGPSRAKDLLFTARRIETDEALAVGLIDRRRFEGLGRHPARSSHSARRAARSSWKPYPDVSRSAAWHDRNRTHIARKDGPSAPGSACTQQGRRLDAYAE